MPFLLTAAEVLSHWQKNRIPDRLKASGRGRRRGRVCNDSETRMLSLWWALPMARLPRDHISCSRSPPGPRKQRRSRNPCGISGVHLGLLLVSNSLPEKARLLQPLNLCQQICHVGAIFIVLSIFLFFQYVLRKLQVAVHLWSATYCSSRNSEACHIIPKNLVSDVKLLSGICNLVGRWRYCEPDIHIWELRFRFHITAPSQYLSIVNFVDEETISNWIWCPIKTLCKSTIG